MVLSSHDGAPLARVLVAGMGSEWRRDDGVGLAVATRVRELGGDLSATWEVVAPLADPSDLLGKWDGADLAVVVDATRSGAEPGTLLVFEIGALAAETSAQPGGAQGTSGPPGGLSPAGRTTSTHGVGLVGTLRLACAVGRAPHRAVVVGVEGLDFGQGQGLSPPVRAAVDSAAHAVVELIREVVPCA